MVLNFLASVLRWRHRATFLADWDDLVGAGPDAFTVRPDCVGRPITPDPVGGSCTGVAVLDEIGLPAREPHADARAPRTKQRTAPLRGVGGRRQTAPDIYVIVSGFGEAAQWYRNLLADPHVRISVGWRRNADAVAKLLAD